jgi:hypothetical protein
VKDLKLVTWWIRRRRNERIRRIKISKDPNFKPLSNMLENNQLLLIVLGVLIMSRSPKQPVSPSTLAGFVRVAIFLRISLVYPKLLKYDLHTSEQHVDVLPSTSHDIVGKKKSRVKFQCVLCKGRHLTHIFPHMEVASKFLEDMTVSQPQLPVAYRKLSLKPPVVDGMINLVPPSVNSVDQVVNLVMFLVEPVDKVVDPTPSLIDPTLLLESETQAVNPF